MNICRAIYIFMQNKTTQRKKTRMPSKKITKKPLEKISKAKIRRLALRRVSTLPLHTRELGMLHLIKSILKTLMS